MSARLKFLFGIVSVVGLTQPLYSALSDVPDISVKFNQSDADFANPERGFYRPLSSDLARLTRREVEDAYAQGYRLLYARIDLEAYRQTVLPPKLLEKLDAAFAVARRSGVKLIVRATYNYPQGETDYQSAQDAPLPRVLGHLAQLKPLFNRNADVIAFVQAGFIGAWGEWHASSNNLTAPDARTRIKDALLDAVPSTRFVQFRYPPYIAAWAPTLPIGSALSDQFRVGFHNDCFLASATDVGTFEDDPGKRAQQQAYLDRLGDIAPFGGETCKPADEPGAEPRLGCGAILAEGKRYNLTYLNTSYYRPLFHERWLADGCMADVRRSMGYRISLVNVSHPATARHGQPVDMTIVIRNSGWARLYNPRPVEMLFRDRKTGVVRRISASGADPRAWLPGSNATEQLRVMLPADMNPGTYDVHFALPDADRRIANDSRYAIRIANSDDASLGQRWIAKLGAFNLGTMLTVE